jgi:hypothetical protein
VSKTNCWEFKRCDREPNGSKVDELGVCPASTEKTLDGIHGGKNAGRSCWVVAGSICKGEIQGTFAKKYKNCILCDFHVKVAQEEAKNFCLPSSLLFKL